MLKEFGASRLKLVPMLLLLVTSSWAILCATQMAQLSPPTKEEDFMPKDHMSTGYRDENAKGYLAGQDYRYWDIEFYAGIKSLKINPDFDRYLPNNKDTLGEAVFDPAFSLHPPEVQ